MEDVENSDSGTPTIELDISENALREFLKFLYHGEAFGKVTADWYKRTLNQYERAMTAIDLCILAEDWGITDLHRQSMNYLSCSP